MNRSGSWSFRDWARSWAAGVHCDNHWCEGTVSHTKFGCVLSAANDIVPHGKDNCSFDGHHMSVQDVQLFDMVLTSSARLLVLTGDVNYRDSYFMKIEPLEDFGYCNHRAVGTT